MSLSALKKVLASLTSEQKDELILDLYSARRQAKEYLDFFVDPDINRLMERSVEAIHKEVNRRGKYGYNKPKITNIRNVLKDVATLRPGEEYVIRLHFFTIKELAQAAVLGAWFPDACIKSFTRIMDDGLRIANTYGNLGDAVRDYNIMIDSIPLTLKSAKYMKKILSDALDDILKAL